MASYALSRTRRIIREWVRGRAEPFLFCTTAWFCNIKHQRNWSYIFSFDSNDKLNDPNVGIIVRSGPRVYNDIIVGVKSYMEVSNETSDRIPHTAELFEGPLSHRHEFNDRYSDSQCVRSNV